MTPMAAPMPMPAFAPVLRPLLLEEEELVEEASAGEEVEEGMLDGEEAGVADCEIDVSLFLLG